MTNLLEEAINSNDGDHAAKVIQEALGIESDDVANYVFPKNVAEQPRTARTDHWRVVADNRGIGSGSLVINPSLAALEY